jgi:hypothetical protein
LREWRAWLIKFKQPDFVATPDSARQLFELATATGKALADADAAWQTLKASPAGKDATALSDPKPEALRKLLYDTSATAPLAVPKNVEDYYADDAKAPLKQRRDELKQLQDSLPKLPEAMPSRKGRSKICRSTCAAITQRSAKKNCRGASRAFLMLRVSNNHRSRPTAAAAWNSRNG